MNALELVKRRTGIGGSEAAAALGLSRYRTPFQLYLEKIGEIEEPENEAAVLTRGKRFEPILREMYEEQTGRKVSQFFEPVKSDIVPFMFVTPDGLANDDRYLEIKTARNRHDWGEPGTDEIPVEYLTQVQHGLFVTRLVIADVFVAFSLDDVQLYEVHADQELQEMIVEGEKKFWKHVETLTPPELTTYEDVVTRYRKASKKAIEATQDVQGLVSILSQVKASNKAGKESETYYKAEIMKFMGEHDTLLDPEGKPIITWKETKERQAFDVEAFKADHPDLWAKYQKAGKTQRRFLLK